MELPARQRDPSVSEYLRSLKDSPKFGPQVVCHKTFEKTAPLYSRDGSLLSSDLAAGLRQAGIAALYEHQAEAFAAVAAGHNVIVATPTSSGKSMVYNLPVFEKILSNGTSHALYLFPLKALSQDQLRSLTSLYATLPELQRRYPAGIAAIYDGDTNPYKRRKIRENTPPILIANPEMVHLSFLPFHENWGHFFKNLDYVVIDEVHTYRGVFGSHVAWLIRRLKRVLHYYGKKTQFILSSATIGNPGEFAEKLIGDKVEVITRTGAPQSKKNFLFLNPWDSPAYTASQMLEASMKRGLRTIVYTQSRKMTELISLWTRPRLGALANKISSYRAGFIAEERREIERKLADGSLLGVISTSALELGIDIGDLDICILVGYPGSIMASWQRGGRVGRGGRESAIILVGSEDALDQYYMNNPERFFSKHVESAVLNPGNGKILKEHLLCAAAEIPLHVCDSIIDDENVQKGIEELKEAAALLLSADGQEYYAARKRPQRNVSLRGSGSSMAIINGETGLILGEVDAARALKECHEGAIYLHKMSTWFVEKFDLMAKEIVVMGKRATFYTMPMTTKDTEILTIADSRNIYGCRLCYGNLKVSEHVTGYQKRNNGTNKLIAVIPLDLPVQTMETEGFWLDIPAHIVTGIEEKRLHFMGGLHAFEHVMISIFPLLVLCDRNDVGGISCPHHEQTEGATIFIYDGHAGGSGLSAEAFRKVEELIERAHETVKTCDCDNGCPSCVHSPKCGSGNRPIDKGSCLELIAAIVSEKNGRVSLPPVAHIQSAQVTLQLPLSKSQPNEILNAAAGLEVLPARYGVFDLETKYSAEEVGGWHHADKMGISIGVVYDSVLDGCVTYHEHEIAQLVDHLQSLELVVGFNNKRFDNRVLAAYTSTNLSNLPTLDLLEEVTKRLGYRLSLNGIAEHTLGIKKSGDGLMALQWYREKNFEMLCKYCRKDVEITNDLLIYGLENGFFIFSNKARNKVRLPLSLEKAILLELTKPGKREEGRNSLIPPRNLSLT